MQYIKNTFSDVKFFYHWYEKKIMKHWWIRTSETKQKNVFFNDFFLLFAHSFSGAASERNIYFYFQLGEFIASC